MRRALLFNAVVFGILVLGVVAFFLYAEPSAPSTVYISSQGQLSAANISRATSAPPVVAAVPIATTTSITKSKPTPAMPKSKSIVPVSTSTSDEIARIQDPYPTPPESLDTINTDSRAALVNILCEPQGPSSLDPISGSGVIIDPRGIILTNAHVAQYVLLSETPQINLQCVIRTGSPAQATWTASVLFIPPIWVHEHANEILQSHPEGTGEHDYALLYITGAVNGGQLPTQFPYLPFDTRPAIAFPGDEVLVASYPAELVGGINAQYHLYADSSFTTIKQLLTFSSGTPDVVSLGGVIEAQGGSSGGAVVNEWGRLVALIATTSSGTTTADRDLRSIALSYINEDLQAQSGQDLSVFLQADPKVVLQNFSPTAVNLIQGYVSELSTSQQ